MNTLEENKFDLTDRIAVVTGAGGAIGQAIAARLAACGAKIAMLDMNADAAAKVARALSGTGFKVLDIVCDVASDASVLSAAKRVEDELGGCDILVNNAGILPQPCGVERLSAAEVQNVLSVNIASMFLTCRHFGSQMLQKGGGSVINIGSQSAHSPSSSATYAVSKSAVLALTRQTAVEWGPRGIRTNSVSPGFLRTPLTDFQYTPELLDKRTGMIPLRRLGTVTDVAELVAFLASDGSFFVNGQDIALDGGFLLTALMHAQRIEHQYGGFPNGHPPFHEVR